ncbi:hypothetical protein, partial [Anoxybacteroides voinovskiense]|uniref:hypothetical protein n=1 Tax=Anoxybacteroides voinovskiense TaxID=230470 RepID=UPI001C848962
RKRLQTLGYLNQIYPENRNIKKNLPQTLDSIINRQFFDSLPRSLYIKIRNLYSCYCTPLGLWPSVLNVIGRKAEEENETFV